MDSDRTSTICPRCGEQSWHQFPKGKYYKCGRFKCQFSLDYSLEDVDNKRLEELGIV